MPVVQLAPRLAIHTLEINPKGKQTILLLHGLGVTGESWSFQFPVLERSGFHILAPDMRGFGKSTWLGGRATIRDWARDMALLLQHQGAAPACVAGISMGGAVALQLALDYPHLVKRLVLINTFAHLRPRGLTAWLYFLTRFFLAHFVSVRVQAHAVARRIFPRPEQEGLRQVFRDQIMQANPSAYRGAMRALARFNVSDRLPGLHIPTLIISGEQDTTVPLEVQRELCNRLPQARQLIIPGTGHAVIAEQPEIVNAAILEFLANLT